MATFLLLLLMGGVSVQALQPGPQDKSSRVVAVRPGRCTITRAAFTHIPGNPAMIADAGHWNGKRWRHPIEPAPREQATRYRNWAKCDPHR